MRTRALCLVAALALTSCAVPIAGNPAADSRALPADSPTPPSPTASPSTDAPLVVKPVVAGWNTVRSSNLRLRSLAGTLAASLLRDLVLVAR